MERPHGIALKPQCSVGNKFENHGPVLKPAELWIPSVGAGNSCPTRSAGTTCGLVLTSCCPPPFSEASHPVRPGSCQPGVALPPSSGPRPFQDRVLAGGGPGCSTRTARPGGRAAWGARDKAAWEQRVVSLATQTPARGLCHQLPSPQGLREADHRPQSLGRWWATRTPRTTASRRPQCRAGSRLSLISCVWPLGCLFVPQFPGL